MTAKPTVFYAASDVDYPGTHGGSSHVGEAVHSLKKYCNKVYLLCKWRSKQALLEKKENLIIIRLPVPNIPLLRTVAYFLYSFCTATIVQLMDNLDIIYERARIIGGGALLLGFITGRKTYYELNEPVLQVPLLLGELKENSMSYKIIEKLHRFMMKHAAVVVATHKSSLENLEHNQEKIVHYGTNSQKFNPQINASEIIKKYQLTKGKTLLYVGSFSRWHACESMIEAVAQIIKKDKKVKLIMVGHGQQYNKSRELVEKLGVLENVIFVGKVPMEQVPKYINAADVCFALFDRRYPPFKKLGYYYSPIKLHEYKACAKPIIASLYPQIQELVKNKVNGILVNETKIDEITKAVRMLLQNPKLAQKMGKKNREEVEKRYNWDYFNRKILEN